MLSTQEVTADNGVKENPDGNIQLGGDLLIANRNRSRSRDDIKG